MLTDKNVIEYCDINKHIAWDKRDSSYVNYLLNRKYGRCILLNFNLTFYIM